MRREWLVVFVVGACGDDETPAGTCDPEDPEPCENGLVCREADGGFACGVCTPGLDPACGEGRTCEEVEGGDPVCTEPVVIAGRVLRSTDLAPIEGALVAALDENGASASGVAVSETDGTYELGVPVRRIWSQVECPPGSPDYDAGSCAAAVPTNERFTLRASADGYQPFPSGLRTALPIDAREAQLVDRRWVLMNAATDITLIPLPAAKQGRAWIAGTVEQPEGLRGALVVAEGGGAALSTVADAGGAYTIFNVPAGEYDVRAYAAGWSWEPATASVAADPVEGVDLALAGAATATVAGSIQLVNQGDCDGTSVVLSVEATFSDMFVRGEVPPGLRAPPPGTEPNITGMFEIAGVPDGRYVVLAGFENDECVRDPDPNIAGTQILHIEVSGGQDFTATESFKVTGALAVISPGADQPEAVSAPPALEWADDSSENHYEVVVYDAFGDLAWEDDNVPAVTGQATVTLDWGGDPLAPGMYYQFRATSWRESGMDAGPISTTEDLRGVFFSPAE